MQPWEVLAARTVLDRPPWLSVAEQDVRLPNGQIIHNYLLARGRDYAMVFAVRRDGTVPLVHQYKHGAGHVLIDLPAGYLDADEPPLGAAQRELMEETGLTAPDWQLLGHFVVDSNRGDTRAHLYLAREAELTGGQALDATEALDVSYHTPAELREMVSRGQIESLASAAGVAMGLAAMELGRSSGRDSTLGR